MQATPGADGHWVLQKVHWVFSFYRAYQNSVRLRFHGLVGSNSLSTQQCVSGLLPVRNGLDLLLERLKSKGGNGGMRWRRGSEVAQQCQETRPQSCAGRLSLAWGHRGPASLLCTHQVTAAG